MLRITLRGVFSESWANHVNLHARQEVLEGFKTLKEAKNSLLYDSNSNSSNSMAILTSAENKTADQQPGPSSDITSQDRNGEDTGIIDVKINLAYLGTHQPKSILHNAVILVDGKEVKIIFS